MHVLLMLLFAATALMAQPDRKGPPQFDPGDKEGLLSSPNPQIRHAWKRPVHWKIHWNAQPPPPRVPVATPLERQAATAVLDALVALFKATPEGSTGQGYWVLESRGVGYQNTNELPTNAPLARMPLVSFTGLFPFYHEDVERQGKWRLSVEGETESVYYYFNKLPGSLRQDVIAKEDRGQDYSPLEFYLRPRMTGQMNGLPIYENAELLVTRFGRDPWSPAPLGRVLKAALPLYEQDLKAAQDRMAGYKKKFDEVNNPAWEQEYRERFEKQNGALRTTRPANYEARRKTLEHEIRYTREKAAAEANPARDANGAWYWNPVDAHQQVVRRLAALTPAEAAQPACFAEFTASPAKDGRYFVRGDILPAGSSPACRPIVFTNWDYFDWKLPRHVPQILSIRDFGRCAQVDGARIVSRPVTRFDAPPQGCVRHAQMWRELDWNKFAALVTP
jgi:hypothetical protein